MRTKKKVRFVEDGLSPLLTLAHYIFSHYWDIKELDKTIFSFYDRTGELNDPTTSKEYVEFYPYNDGKTNYTTYLIIKMQLDTEKCFFREGNTPLSLSF